MLYVLAILAALSLSAFQYLYKRKALWLFIVRFLVYFIILILLINPKWTQKKQIITKPALYVLADNSASIKLQNQNGNLRDVLKNIKRSALSDKYDWHFFKFGKSLSPYDSLDFSAQQTNVGQALSEMAFLHQSDQKAPIILLTDGQSNIGPDYVYDNTLEQNLNVYPVVFGDTLKYNDLSIDLVNVNPYAYKDNYFPVEVFVSADIDRVLRAQLKILEKGKILFRKKIQLSPKHHSERLNLRLKANKIGFHQYQIVLSGLKNEKKQENNKAFFNVEVLKNAKKILLISDIIHPDLGALKRSLKIHPYIRLDLKKSTDQIQISDYQAFILYQPTVNFSGIFKQLKEKHKSWWIITGKHTDWTFLNREALFFSKQTAHSFENYFPVKNESFSAFKLPELNLDKLPPLNDFYGHIKLNAIPEVAYYSKINGLISHQPLLAFNTRQKQAVLFGENIWQWALISGVNGQKNAFDQLVYQIIQYLSLNQEADHLQLQYKKQFYQTEPVIIRAKFLDKNLEIDEQVKPVLILKHDKQIEKIPMTNQGDFNQVALNTLTSGTYHFTVQNADKSLKKSGYFTVLPFSLEQQTTQTNTNKLRALAHQTGGKTYFPNQIKKLIRDLETSKNYHSQISYQTGAIPLIDFRYLLFLLVLLLALEWGIKKLRGEL